NVLDVHAGVLSPEREMRGEELRVDAIRLFCAPANSIAEIMLVVGHDIWNESEVASEQGDKIDADALVPNDGIAERRGKSPRIVQKKLMQRLSLRAIFP